jgi:F0F1-type ATP synthase membrane subunit b/b'
MVIQEAERNAEQKITDERAQLDREYEDANRHAEKTAEEKKSASLAHTREMLMREKKALTTTFEEAERETLKVAEELATRAKRKQPEAIDDLTKAFLHLFT